MIIIIIKKKRLDDSFDKSLKRFRKAFEFLIFKIKISSWFFGFDEIDH